MSKSFNENQYFSNETNYLENNPIEPIESSWKEIDHNGNVFLEKTYTFKTVDHLNYFLSELIKKSDSISYYPEIFIKEKNVKVYLKNNFVNHIIQEDLMFSKFLDEIYEDIFYLNS